MKPDEIARLRELLGKATPGPWQSMNEYQWDTIIGDIDGPDDGEMRYELVTDITSHHERSRANARLIAAAVNALPALLALAEAVEKAPTGKVDMVCGGDAVVVDEIDNPAAINKKRVRLVEVSNG